ncbi:MAG: SDR family NAD(P)-dependent oxidoreductase [Leeuwenhoekiella sp.]
MSKIALAGLGWLGKPLAVHLQSLGHSIKGSTTSRDKQVLLTNAGIPTYNVLFTEDQVSGQINNFLSEIEILIVLIPPGLRKNSGHNHALKMLHFLNNVEETQVSKVILVSSTAVYDDEQGNVTEKDYPLPKANNGKQLLEVEELFQKSTAFKTTILRFGGLFGGSRNPVKHLAGRTELSNGEAPVNLIHRTDCIHIIEEIIKQDAFGYTFNAVSPQHPTKSAYYGKKAAELGLKSPEYRKNQEDEIFKQIDSVNLKEILDYHFKVKI